MKTQEQQAQTIAEIRERDKSEITTPDAPGYKSLMQCGKDRVMLLEIVDSQAQTIAEIRTEVKLLRALVELADFYGVGVRMNSSGELSQKYADCRARLAEFDAANVAREGK